MSWIAKKLAERRERRQHEVVFYTYPAMLFVWPLILAGLVLWCLDCWGVDSEVLAWVWGITIIAVVMTIGIDINRNVTIFWIVTIVAIWFLVLYLRDVKHVVFFGYIYRFFTDLNPVYSRSLGLMVSIVLAVPYIIMLFWTRVNSKWRITHNEFEHMQFGRVDDGLARGAKRVRSSYPDLLEFIFCMAGDMVIYDSSGNNVLRRIPHLPFLPFVWRRIDRILKSTQITASIADDDETGEHAEGSDDGGDRT